MRRSHTLAAIAVAGAVLTVSGCGATDGPGAEPSLGPSVMSVPGTEPSLSATIVPGPSMVPTLPADDGLVPGESLAAPISDEVMIVATAISSAVGREAQFGNVEINDASDGLILRWFGDPPEELLGGLRSEHPTVPVEVRAVDLLPGDLREAARLLLKDEHDAGVGGVFVRNDCSGITVMVDEDRATEGLDDLAARLTAEAGYPVDIELGVPVAVSG